MKQILPLLLLIAFAMPAVAVSDKEMEEARAITALCYLRYANNGSGYLDELHPATMADLEKNLRDKEKENLKSFKAADHPGDYKNWDKEKLVAYWAETFFSQPGIIEKAKEAKTRVRRRIEAMQIASPAKAADAVAEPNPPSGVEEPAASPVAGASSAEAEADSLAAMLSDAEAQTIADSGADDSDSSRSSSGNYTWIYIVVLCILVGIVVWLVLFASKVLKANPGKASETDSSPEPASSRPSEQLMRRIDEAEDEVRIAAEENARLREEVRKLREHISYLEKNLGDREATQRMHGEPASRKVDEVASAPLQEMAAPVQPAPRTASAPRTHATVIYLGRANAKGIFVRADRNLKPDASVFRLETTDGYAGTFRVANNEQVWERALADPESILAGACVARNLAATEGVTEIVTESAGTAIFEGGCWKVIRKAKLRYA